MYQNYKGCQVTKPIILVKILYELLIIKELEIFLVK